MCLDMYKHAGLYRIMSMIAIFFQTNITQVSFPYFELDLVKLHVDDKKSK